jgi:hypothetical protein
LITDLPKKFTDLPIEMKNLANPQQEGTGQLEKVEYKFSKELKA